ncbi:MAG TPA: hypothetical protein VM802_23485 [Chitinophaga sp.]|uniref:hypothetical protein n=1 Tax=Chitinophaga sp. TaxID=1869181 RepID=UPI002C56776B|nr:hypothetical protein [Chitinophaga sp.]HVI47852.1 hypothetical protein [Chitinophaga sp.]
MSTFAFSNTNSGNASLYTTPDDNGWCAFVLASGTSSSQSTLSLKDTAVIKGYYLFASTAPLIGADTLVQNVWTYMTNVPRLTPDNALMWLNAPDDALTADNVTALFLQQYGTGGFVIQQQMNFSFGNNYAALYIGNIQLFFTVDNDNSLFSLNINDQPTQLTLSANSVASSTVTQPLPLIIPFTGIGRGCMRFVLGFNMARDFSAVAYDLSIKYFYTSAADNSLSAISYPVIPNGSLNDLLLCQASINPVDMLNAHKTGTYFALLGQTVNSDTLLSGDTLFNTYYTADYGYQLMMKPVVSLSAINGTDNYPGPGSALLVFSCSDAASTQKWYMVPSGNFTVVLDSKDAVYLDSNKQMRFMNGLAGTESVSFTPEVNGSTGDLLCFTPKQAAYADRFPLAGDPNLDDDGNVLPLLNTSYQTAWAAMQQGSTSNATVIYHAQPVGASLFAAGQDVFTDNKEVLGSLVPNAGVLSDTIIFPMASYGAAQSSNALTDIRQYELQIISPQRKNVIGVKQQQQLMQARKSMQNTAADIIPGTSPQGFYIETDKNTSIWKLMQLASNQYLQSDGNTSPLYKLFFSDLGHTLQSAFQTNQLFNVISFNPTVGGNPLLGSFSNEMYMDGWPFILDVPQQNVYGQFNNVLIFKFRNGALTDHISNPQGWTMADQFNMTDNNGLQMLSAWLQQYVQTGINNYTVNKDNDYYKFYTAVTDPEWQGVLALAIKVDVQHFPAALQGLLAGIDLQRFNAHHFGIDISVVHNDNGALSMLPVSALFGLIDYEDQVFASLGQSVERYKKEAPINTDVDYDFKVLNLKVLFSNAKVVNFNSNIALTLNKLFGERTKADNRENLLILRGTCENHNGVPAYTFVGTDDNLIYVDSAIIQDVEIQKASFSTTVPQSGGQGIVQSVFSCWGFINFNKLSDFDILSFGSETNGSPHGAGIACAGLNLDMDFPLETPSTRTFRFDISHLSADIGQSTARNDSLYRHFPLQLTGMTTGTKDNTPASQGFLNVTQWINQPQEGISGDWYGLVFTLNMGTLGALASAAGFNTTFLAAWNVGGSGTAAALKLPGVNPQAPFFSLQGVLKLDIGSVSMSLADGSTTGKMAYLMKINNIAVKLLSLSFPPGGNIGFFLFGNPDQDAPPESLGWYAAYVKK